MTLKQHKVNIILSYHVIFFRIPFSIHLFQAQTLSLNNGKHLIEMNNLRQKIVGLREENSKLFVQNTKLMTELEATTYKLQDCQAEVSYYIFRIYTTLFTNLVTKPVCIMYIFDTKISFLLVCNHFVIFVIIFADILV